MSRFQNSFSLCRALTLLSLLLVPPLAAPNAQAQGATGSAEAATAGSSSRPAGARAPSRGNAFNPDIGINTLLLYRNSNRGNDPASAEKNGFSLQEAELQFAADVDPYSRVQALFSVHPELDDTVLPQRTEYVFEPEEVFAETISLPLITLKGGKFKAAMGRHNQLHTHAFPFIDAPLVNTTLLGDEGLNDVGVSAAVLVPAPWYLELTLQGLSGETEGLDYFNSVATNDYVYLAHLKNLFDLSEDLTLELGASGATGRNSVEVDGGYSYSPTDLVGADLTLKWRPMRGGKYHALVWGTEALARVWKRPGSKNEGKGYFTYLQYQFTDRWWVQGRSEYLEVEDTDPVAPLPIAPVQRKYSALVGFFPSEFSGVRLQYDHLDDDTEDVEHRVMLQLNFSIGAHPAHLY